ncbi:heavy metal-associated isoprenylated plant protein 35-like [Salvia miltiorrhiza]|uniref:heavy metal-associated isoprenylated plant protein 35-like n=1 Tax=Salvia miltiorrhiza TaxID=226208 RepID=UPI0025AD4B86|nr:heavy metal-associated isoprenylated plant protein 35-like [Salvia miltiorrhiza]
MAEESAQPIKQLKTTIIRASIHCQGCRRKVEKILSQIHGVEHVDVDAQQHKVTVTGDVDADTLIRKLIKSGKNAELWPQISQRRANPAIGRKKEVETQGKADGAPPASDDNNTTAEAETAAPVKAGEVDGDGDGVGGGGGDAKAVNGPAVKKTDGDVNVPVKKSEEESNCKGEERCAAAPEKSDGGGNGGESGASAKKKKKKKRAQSGNPEKGLENGETNESPPRHHHHHQFPPPPAAYAVSYNTAYPSSSYTASCYAAPPPHGYAYVHQAEAAAPSSDPELNPRQPLDSFELFSDENPNGCFIM